ncbi:aldo/keto reductase [Novosphingobium beihaiensis]|uniref:Aldo/keto reductase n=1 Tax=Novosphingobium beihaiensis TaxID=2930389 RepID=A0ABT0BRP1_9SPHN|nr:aldo/keto reductase [Novosphingobium beihaiensis]MCJ2187471.1 aldo/keto reductase [Novosphingobium beihaiensis]
MEKVSIPGIGLSVSRFIFGTASLFNAGDSSARQKLLHSAVEQGFSHFDTAPYYGFGAAERDLAPVLRAYPGVSVTTKVGIYSPGGERQPDWLIFGRKVAGRAIKAISRPEIDFSIDRAKRALSDSLSRLGRDHIELYMLHEPEIGLLDTDEWQYWLEKEKSRGRIGAYGLALRADQLRRFIQVCPQFCGLIQMQDSLDYKEADLLALFSQPMQITYGYVSAARARGDERSVAMILQKALERNRTGALIVSSTRPERLGQYRVLLEKGS